MHSRKPPALALALSGVILFGAITLTAAAPGKQKSKKPANSSASAQLIAAGKKVYASSGCAACHLMSGKGGKIGPELTHVGKTRKADWLTTQIRDPKKHKANGTMPAYGEDKINAKDLKALAAYLASLK